MSALDEEQWIANLEQNIKNSQKFKNCLNMDFLNDTDEHNNLSGLDQKVGEHFQDEFRRERANSKRFLKEEIELGSGGEYVLR